MEGSFWFKIRCRVIHQNRSHYQDCVNCDNGCLSALNTGQISTKIMGPRLGLNCMYIEYTHCPFLVSQMKRTWVVLCSFFWQSNLCLKQIQITMYNDWWYCAVIANLQIEKISNTILCFWAGCFQKLPNDQATRPFQPQTWNLSKNLHDPIFGRKNFTHWKRVNWDYFRQQKTVKMHHYQ